MYNFEIEHNLLADALSRLNIPECRQDQEITNFDQIINAVNIVLNADGHEMRIHEWTHKQNQGTISSWVESEQ